MRRVPVRPAEETLGALHLVHSQRENGAAVEKNERATRTGGAP